MPIPESLGPAFSPEGMSVGLRRSLKHSLHQSTTSFVKVSSTPSLLYTVLTVHRFPLLRRQMVVQNLFETFSMASLNSSHARVFASVTAIAAHCLACCYPPAASGVSRGADHRNLPEQKPVTITIADVQQQFKNMKS